MELWKHQIEISDKGTEVLKKYNIVLLAMEVRTGKTITSFEIIKKYGAKKALFVTKKKVIGFIKEDYELYKDEFELQIINYESAHKIKDKDFDIVVLDESHSMGAFPKPSQRFIKMKQSFGHLPIILSTGTVTPESYSQFFHQFFVSKCGVWAAYRNFYKWASKYVNVFKKRVGNDMWANDYSKANYDLIMKDIRHLIFTMTQKEAGFTSKIEEKILYVDMAPKVYSLCERLKEDKVIEGKPGEVLLADTSVKEMGKLHQLYSGTVKLENGETRIIDKSKGLFIQNYFKLKKIAIFYKFKAERDLLKQVFGSDITEDLEEFNKTNKNIMLQIVSGREGISLKKADHLVYYNIDFSATSYWQSRDRLTTKDRKSNVIYWIFSNGGIEDKVYKAVQSKKSFTTNIYKKC